MEEVWNGSKFITIFGVKDDIISIFKASLARAG
jgi:hypothetical protein